jgi:hypothetical protein
LILNLSLLFQSPSFQLLRPIRATNLVNAAIQPTVLVAALTTTMNHISGDQFDENIAPLIWNMI